jgi:hypothetical protein
MSVNIKLFECLQWGCFLKNIPQMSVLAVSGQPSKGGHGYISLGFTSMTERVLGSTMKIRSLKILDTIGEQVKIRQKTIKYTPLEKLQDALMAILSGAHGLVEINHRVRADQVSQCAFKRTACAEQYERGEIKRVVMNKAAPLARSCAQCLQVLLKQGQVSVILGEI